MQFMDFISKRTEYENDEIFRRVSFCTAETVFKYLISKVLPVF